MTESDWKASTDPKLLLGFMARRTSNRKLRLFAVACCYEIEHLMEKRSHEAVEVAEKFADGVADESERRAAMTKAVEAQQFVGDQHRGTPRILAARAARAVIYQDDATNHAAIETLGHVQRILSEDGRSSDAPHAVLVREIFGNPFHYVTVDQAWQTDTVLSLAKQMYDSRDFSAMPSLVDALQDAGCDMADILDHCRGPGPHVRGCWVVDLILGKE